MHWPTADRPADAARDPLAPVPPDSNAAPDTADAAGEPAEVGADGEPAPMTAYAPPSPFGAAGAGENPWPNRVIWAAAAAAVVFGGVWVAGLWEVKLDDPPAGRLAGAPAASLGSETDPAKADWPAGDDWGADLTDAAESAGPDDDDLAALWGDDPAATDPGMDEQDPDGADAFDLLADAAPGGALDAAPFDPTPADLPEPTAAPDDLWGDPPPAAAPTATADLDAEPPGGVFAAVRPEPTPPAAAPAPAAAGDPSADPPAAPVAAQIAEPSPAPVRTAAVTPADAAFDPFGADAAAPAAVTPASAVAPREQVLPEPEPAPAPPAAPAADEELLGAVDAALAAGEVLQAHTALSRLWWDDAASRSAIRGRLDGTARQIYFDAASHFMTPRTVAAGETLEQVAAELSVPAMYLARVNRVAPASVSAGDELKVIRGPFGAALDLSGAGGGTFTVHAHGYYVRAFPAKSEAVEPGEYRVEAKVRTPGGVRVLLTSDEGGTLTLTGGPATPGRPSVGLAPADAEQIFDLLDTGGALSVRP